LFLAFSEEEFLAALAMAASEAFFNNLLGLVTHRQMIVALITAVENAASGVRVVTVPEIRQSSLERSDLSPASAPQTSAR
jgi:hypothetical protein